MTDDVKLNNNIKTFKTSLKHQIKSYRKRIIEPGSIQYTTKDIEKITEEELKDDNHDYLRSKSNKILYNQCCNLALPISNLKIFRFIQLRSFAVILESTSQACQRNNPIEICFHLRNYLEYAASFSYALDNIIPLANEFLINIKVHRVANEYNPSIMEYSPSKEFQELYLKLFKLFTYYSAHTNIDHRKEIDGNDSLVPDKDHPLKSINIIKKLQAFEKKIDQFHPTYDLLSEYVHPNSYALMSVIGESFIDDQIIFKDRDLKEGMGIIGYFFEEKNQAFLESIILEILKSDSELLSLQLKISKKIKPALKKLISSQQFKSDLDYSKELCVCGSRRKLIECCAK